MLASPKGSSARDLDVRTQACSRVLSDCTNEIRVHAAPDLVARTCSRRGNRRFSVGPTGRSGRLRKYQRLDRFLPPEVAEARRRQLGIAHRVQD
jgi:hypothetical protein